MNAQCSYIQEKTRFEATPSREEKQLHLNIERENKESDERNDTEESNMSNAAQSEMISTRTTMIKELRQIATKYYSLINRV